MSANTSMAVRQNRAHRAPAALDYFPTPPWATRALCEFLSGGDRGGPAGSILREHVLPIGLLHAWEPACGEMHMARPLAEYFGHVIATDVFRYSALHGICDFLTTGWTYPAVDFVATNPPFIHAEKFVQVALSRARVGVAMLVRSAWLEGGGRFESISLRPRPHTS